MIKLLKTVLFVVLLSTILYVSIKTTVKNQPEEVGVAVVEETTPDPEPRRPGRTGGDAGGSGGIRAFIEKVFKNDVAWALRVARCESGMRPDAVSPSGKYVSLFQFDRPTFNNNCTGDIFSWKDQVVCAKKLYDKGETWRWPTCSS